MDSRSIVVLSILLAAGAMVAGLMFARFRIARAKTAHARLATQIGLATWTLASLVLIFLGAMTMLALRLMGGERDSLWLALTATAFAAYLFYRIFIIRTALLEARKKLNQ